MAGEVENDDPFAAGFAALSGFIDDRLDGVSGFGSGNDAFCAGEESCGSKDVGLGIGFCFHEAKLQRMADHG